MFAGFLKERRTTLLWRSLLAFALLGCARYGVWYIHAQHVAFAASCGKTPDDLWSEASKSCDSASTYDYTLQLLYPLTRYFSKDSHARDSMVQLAACLELLLLGANVWLFIVYDVWILLQISIAAMFTLAVQSAAWTPILCEAVRLPVGAAWLSDALAGGVSQLPLGGFSGSTVLVALGLYNLYAQRRATEVAFFCVLLLFQYVVYHLVLRWHGLLDELHAIAFAVALVSVLRQLRVLHNIETLAAELDAKRIQTPITPVTPLTPTTPANISLTQALQGYAVEETLATAPPMFRAEYESDKNAEDEFKRTHSVQELVIYGGTG
jgi:hypothetical protein